MKNTKDKALLPSSACRTCLGCGRLDDRSFTGKKDCAKYRNAGNRVWCADAVVQQYVKTGRIK